MTDMFELSGRVTLVSGPAGRLGKETSLALAEVGGDVVLADIDEAGVQATAAEIESLKQKALPVVCDVSQPEQIQATFVKWKTSFKRFVICCSSNTGSRRWPSKS